MNNRDLRNYKEPKEKYTEKGLGHMHWALALLVRFGARFAFLFVTGMAGVTLGFGGSIICSAIDIGLWFMLTKERYRGKGLWKAYNWFLIIITIMEYMAEYVG